MSGESAVPNFEARPGGDDGRFGIYTLANDAVVEQLTALLNSIEANGGSDLRICVIPYSDEVTAIRRTLRGRSRAFLLEDRGLVERWASFARGAWTRYLDVMGLPAAGFKPLRTLGYHHRFIAFDDRAPFERFVYMDADTLLLSPLTPVRLALEDADIVAYDYQDRDPSHVYQVEVARSQKLLDTGVFCTGFFGGRRGAFPPSSLEHVLRVVGERFRAAALYPSAPDQSLLNFMRAHVGLRLANLAQRLPEDACTGNAVTSTHFDERGGAVFDRGRRLTYLHYIGCGAEAFRRLCRGENVEIPYREMFLHYRYLREPGARPALAGPRRPLRLRPPLWHRLRARLRSWLRWRTSR